MIDAHWAPAVDLDSVREQLRKAIYYVSYQKWGAEPERIQTLNQGACSFAEFGVRSGLIDPTEGNEWLDAIWERKTYQNIAEKYLKDIPVLPERTTREDFFENIYKKDGRDVVSIIFDHMHTLLSEHRRKEANEILATVDVNSLTEDGLLSFLTITNGSKLSARKDYFDRAWKSSINRFGKSETKRLLAGLDEEPKNSLFSMLGLH